jgi:hypothetical protein
MADNITVIDGSANSRVLKATETSGVLTPHHIAESKQHNGTDWESAAGNKSVTGLASAARTATTSTSDIVATNARGVRVIINATAKTSTPSVVPTIEVKDPVSGVYTAVLTGAAITDAANVQLRVYPGIAAVNNLSANDVIARTFRVTMTAANANALTYSVGVDLLV